MAKKALQLQWQNCLQFCSDCFFYIPEKIDSSKDETSSLTPYRSFEFDQFFFIVVIVFCCFLAVQYQQNKNTTNKQFFFFKQTKNTHRKQDLQLHFCSHASSCDECCNCNSDIQKKNVEAKLKQSFWTPISFNTKLCLFCRLLCSGAVP